MCGVEPRFEDVKASCRILDATERATLNGRGFARVCSSQLRAHCTPIVPGPIHGRTLPLGSGVAGTAQFQLIVGHGPVCVHAWALDDLAIRANRPFPREGKDRVPLHMSQAPVKRPFPLSLAAWGREKRCVSARYRTVFRTVRDCQAHLKDESMQDADRRRLGLALDLFIHTPFLVRNWRVSQRLHLLLSPFGLLWCSRTD